MANDATLRVGADTRDAERALGNLQKSLVSLGKIVVFGGLAKQFVDLSDQLTGLENRLRLVAREGQSSSDVFNLINASAISMGAPLKDVGDLFFRIANNTRDMGLAQSDQLRVTELMVKAFQNTGLSMTEARGAIVQFGQALAAGTLRGDELNSILEQAPPIADAIAAHFNVSRGALKALGEQGKITSKDVITAIKAAGESIDRDFASRVPTIANSFAVLSNVIAGVSKKFDEQSGLGRVLSYSLLIVADAVISVYEWFDKWGKVIGWVAEAIAFIYVPLKVARTLFMALIGPIEWVIGLFRTGGKASAVFGAAMEKLVEYIAPVLTPITVLGQRIAAIFGVIGAGATALGLGNLVAGIKELFGDDKKTMAEKYEKKLKDINERLGNTKKASDEAGKATDALGAAQVKFNQEFDKAIGRQQAMTALEANRSQYTEKEYEIKKLIADWEQKALEAGVKLTAKQREALTVLASQTYEIQAQKKAYEELKKVREEALGTVVSTLQTADPRLKVESEYQKKRQQIEDAYTIDSTISYETYINALKALDQQYLLDKQKAQMDALQRSLEIQNLEKQAIIDKYELEKKQIDFLDKYRQTVFSQELQRQGFTRDQAEDMAKKRAEFEKKTETEKAQWAIEQGANVFSELGKYNRQAFEASKALNIANAVMNTYTGVTKALATYPPPFNFIAAGATLAFGLAQIATIRSQQYSGRAIGGSVIKDKSYVVGENGPEVFTPTGSGRITPNNQLGGGTTNINFTINAVDSRGVDQLLQERRPMIVSMIRSAMSDRGVKPTV